MRVLIVNQHLDDTIGGSELQCDIIARNLKVLGHEVKYAIIGPKKQEYVLSYDYDLVSKKFFKSFRTIVKNYKPDIIYWRYNKFNLLKATIISRIYNVKFIYSISAYSDTEKYIWTGRQIWNFEKISNYNNLLKKYIGKMRILTFPILSIFNYLGFYIIDGVVSLNSDFIGKLPVKKQIKISNSIDISYEPFNWKNPFVIWVANIKSKKNPEEFIRLAKHFESSGVDFLMVGNIQDNQYNYINNSELLPENFYYLGPKSPTEVNGIIRESLFLVHTCDPEGFGNNFIQAWIQERPTISLYFDPENIITKNSIGFFSGTFDKMKNDVEELINNISLRKEMGLKAKKFADSEFDAKSNTKKLENFMLKIIND